MEVKNKQNIDKYQRLTQREHILKRPGMYVGNIQTEKSIMYVIDSQFSKVEKKEIDFNAGFIKLFDEILTNASDHCVRTKGAVKNIEIFADRINNTISIKNDGPGIPIQKKEGVWIPQMLFAELMTGENYNDLEERFVGGMNGIGASLVNILSKKFSIECSDGINLYKQECENNLLNINDPKIKKSSSKSYTQITYLPDLQYFNKKDISDDDILFMRKRAMDIAVYCKCNVYFDGVKIPVKTLTDYAKMHVDENAEIFTEKLNDNWEVLLTESSNENFEHTSLVNGISTYKGGTHVDYIMGNIVRRLIEDLTKGNKGIKIKASDIKSKFNLFLICKVPNPSFDTQTKENMTLKLTRDMTKECDLSDKAYKAILKSEIVKSILEWVQMKEQLELNKMNKKAGGKTIRVDKLVDAHKAGTSEGWKAGLLLCEGDSAKNTALAGIAEVGRDYFGAFPLKGKPLNVRDAKISRIIENQEIANVLQIVGLVPGKVYTSLVELRYGKIIFMTDADCFEENTLILTKDGDKKLKNLTINDEVLTHTGQYKKILNIINSIKQEVISFVIAGTEYLCNKEHILLVLRKGEITEIKAKYLKHTDLVMIKRN